MAQRTIPRLPGTHLGRKSEEANSRIAGKGRRILYTRYDLSHTIISPTDLILQKQFSAGFLKSSGDAIHFTMAGIMAVAGGANIRLQLRIGDETGTPLGVVIDSDSWPGPLNIQFFAQGIAYLNSDKEFAANGTFLSGEISPTVFNNRTGTATFSAKKLTFDLYATGDAGGVVTIDHFSAEFAPAVLK